MSKRLVGASSVALGLYFPTGSRYETRGNNGISHFIEHLIFKGTPSRSGEQINREMDQLGGTANAYTSKETLCLHARVLPEQLPRLIELFADLAAHALPEGLEGEIECEREVILAEIAALEDAPEDLVGDLADRAYFGEHPLALPVVGSPRAVARLAPAELRGHFRSHIVARDLVVAAAGCVDHDDLVGRAREAFGDLPRGGAPRELVAPSPRRSTRVLERDLEQVHVCLSAPGIARGDLRRRGAELLSLIVGDGYSSRLFREVRDRRGLAYSVFSGLAGYLDAGSFNVYLGVTPAKLDETLTVVAEVLASVRDGEIGEQELEDARRALCTNLRLSCESSSARMSFLAERVMLGESDLMLEPEIEAIARTELATLRALAAELLAGPLALAAVGPVSLDRLPARGLELPA
ncbi:MAG: M16 family metallopeptidase [Myxococcota bacterium]